VVTGSCQENASNKKSNFRKQKPRSESSGVFHLGRGFIRTQPNTD
jgi:hypothetical protein